MSNNIIIGRPTSSPSNAEHSHVNKDDKKSNLSVLNSVPSSIPSIGDFALTAEDGTLKFIATNGGYLPDFDPNDPALKGKILGFKFTDDGLQLVPAFIDIPNQLPEQHRIGNFAFDIGCCYDIITSDTVPVTEGRYYDIFNNQSYWETFGYTVGQDILKIYRLHLKNPIDLEFDLKNCWEYIDESISDKRFFKIEDNLKNSFNIIIDDLSSSYVYLAAVTTLEDNSKAIAAIEMSFFREYGNTAIEILTDPSIITKIENLSSLAPLEYDRDIDTVVKYTATKNVYFQCCDNPTEKLQSIIVGDHYYKSVYYTNAEPMSVYVGINSEDKERFDTLKLAEYFLTTLNKTLDDTSFLISKGGIIDWSDEAIPANIFTYNNVKISRCMVNPIEIDIPDTQSVIRFNNVIFDPKFDSAILFIDEQKVKDDEFSIVNNKDASGHLYADIVVPKLEAYTALDNKPATINEAIELLCYYKVNDNYLKITNEMTENEYSAISEVYINEFEHEEYDHEAAILIIKNAVGGFSEFYHKLEKIVNGLGNFENIVSYTTPFDLFLKSSTLLVSDKSQIEDLSIPMTVSNTVNESTKLKLTSKDYFTETSITKGTLLNINCTFKIPESKKNNLNRKIKLDYSLKRRTTESSIQIYSDKENNTYPLTVLPLKDEYDQIENCYICHRTYRYYIAEDDTINSEVFRQLSISIFDPDLSVGDNYTIDIISTISDPVSLICPKMIPDISADEVRVGDKPLTEELSFIKRTSGGIYSGDKEVYEDINRALPDGSLYLFFGDLQEDSNNQN